MAVGFQFPFTRATGSLGYFEESRNDFDIADNDIRVLLNTNRGERLMHYDFGFSPRDFLFEQLDDGTLKSRMTDRISIQFSKWLRYIILDDLQIFFPGEKPEIPENTVSIVITYRLSHKPGISNTTTFDVG